MLVKIGNFSMSYESSSYNLKYCISVCKKQIKEYHKRYASFVIYIANNDRFFYIKIRDVTDDEVFTDYICHSNTYHTFLYKFEFKLDYLLSPLDFNSFICLPSAIISDKIYQYYKFMENVNNGRKTTNIC